MGTEPGSGCIDIGTLMDCLLNQGSISFLLTPVTFWDSMFPQVLHGTRVVSLTRMHTETGPRIRMDLLQSYKVEVPGPSQIESIIILYF